MHRALTPQLRCHTTRISPLRTCAPLHAHSQQKVAANPGDHDLLTAFWRSRGVQSEQHIAYLVDLGVQTTHTADDDLGPELPGANAYWQCQGSSDAAAQVGAVSQRLLKLQAVLGGHDSGIDLAWMITREPR